MNNTLLNLTSKVGLHTFVRRTFNIWPPKVYTIWRINTNLSQDVYNITQPFELWHVSGNLHINVTDHSAVG